MAAERIWDRNFGFISVQGQQQLQSATVAIAGLGGVGGRIATELTRLGVGRLKLADPDTFELTNLNRQEGSGHTSLGKNKAATIAGHCRDINPDLVIEVFEDGVSEANLAQFVTGASYIVEATDFSLPHLGVMIAREARRQAVPLIMSVEIGFGANVVWFPSQGYSYEQYLGLEPSISLDDLKQGKVAVSLRRWLPYLPAYGDLAVLERVSSEHISMPAIAPAVDISASIVSTQIISGLTGSKWSLPPAPAVFVFDAKEHQSRIIRHSKLSHYLSLARLVVRNKLGRHDAI